MAQTAFEVNFDGLVGPTHNYAGLSSGNVASTNNAGDISSPKAAAKQGLQKAKALADLGLKQGILAPHARPAFEVLRRLGFDGSDAQVIEKAGRQCPEVLAACYSASAMWTANAATVSPSADSSDGKVHFTPANLNNKFHRSIEPVLTSRILKACFPDPAYFVHHKHLPEAPHFGDEGAANHTRFCTSYAQVGVQLFVYGRYGFKKGMPEPTQFPARQTFEASQAVARLHKLSEDKVVYAQQNPKVIDQGVFHNDVISVGNGNVYFCHEDALLHTDTVIAEIQKKFIEKFYFIKVPRSSVSVEDAVKSYLFNSQLVSLSNGRMAIIVPEESKNNSSVWSYLQQMIEGEHPVDEVKVYNVTESMKNGGGPACLRLRVALNDAELSAVNPGVLLDDSLFNKLNHWVDKHYRDQIKPDDLLDPKLAEEVKICLDELTQILDIGSVYDFQR